MTWIAVVATTMALLVPCWSQRLVEKQHAKHQKALMFWHLRTITLPSSILTMVQTEGVRGSTSWGSSVWIEKSGICWFRSLIKISCIVFEIGTTSGLHEKHTKAEQMHPRVSQTTVVNEHVDEDNEELYMPYHWLLACTDLQWRLVIDNGWSRLYILALNKTSHLIY